MENEGVCAIRSKRFFNKLFGKIMEKIRKGHHCRKAIAQVLFDMKMKKGTGIRGRKIWI